MDILPSGGNHFNGNKRPAFQPLSTVHALTIFIQRPNCQAALLAKICPHQSARLKLRNQGLDLGKTTTSVLHSHCAHSASAPLNAAQEKDALLRRIQLINQVQVLPNTGCWEFRGTRDYYGYGRMQAMSQAGRMTKLLASGRVGATNRGCFNARRYLTASTGSVGNCRSLRRAAILTNSARDSAFIFRIALPRCFFTVTSLMSR
jgi:hypothetical protein